MRAPWYRHGRKQAPSGWTIKEKKREQKRLKGRGCRRHTGVMPRRGKGRTTQSKR